MGSGVDPSITGNIAEPLLGLSPDEYAKIADDVDTIYHNAAFVHHIKPYYLLKLPMKIAPLKYDKLAVTGKKRKRILFVSTISAATKTNESGQLVEEFPEATDNLNDLLTGYSQTKWVSERLLRQALELLEIPVTVLRFGWVCGSTTQGIIPATTDHHCLFIKACLQMKLAPNWSMEVRMNPIDEVIKRVLQISLQRDAVGKIYNIANLYSIPWTDLVSWINKNIDSLSIEKPIGSTENPSERIENSPGI